MPSTKDKSRNRSPNGPIHDVESKPTGQSPEVLTASEAAAYLRVAETEVLRLAQQYELPGRRIGNEWRFLKAGLQDWLRTPAQSSGKEAILTLVGAWKDDPDIERIVREAVGRRGRQVAENQE
jgi:excisionase family DNA binding protein